MTKTAEELKECVALSRLSIRFAQNSFRFPSHVVVVCFGCWWWCLSFLLYVYCWSRLGNQAFVANDYIVAIQHYTEAIQLDSKNHVLFSNRSASYASIQKYDKAAMDAKECIRLNPTFVKGYYRLVTAQVGLKQYDLALATIRQGLTADNNNSQLLKQQRMVQQLKRSQEASYKKRQDQESKLPSNIPEQQQQPLSSSSNSDFEELMEQFTQTRRNAESEKVNLYKLEREEKIATFTKEELEPLPEEQKCYRSVGKMFLLSKKNHVLERLNTTIETCQKKQDETKQKITYLEQKMQSQQQNLQELQQMPTNE